MKQLAWLGAVATVVLLSGCWTIYETPQTEKLDRSKHFDMNLKLEGFARQTLQQTGFTTGTTSATAYNWKTNSTVSASGNSSYAHYEYRPDESFANAVTDVFENLGFNIRSDSPELVLAGRIGKNGHHPTDHGHFWYRDVPIFILSLPLGFMINSAPRINDAELIVYDLSGKRLANYYSEQEYYTFSIAFPFANLFNEKIYADLYIDNRAAEFALVVCLNQFFADLKNGKFDQAVRSAKEHYAAESSDKKAGGGK